MPSVTILMATWNGAARLVPQLDSFAAQELPPARLIVSDDGSSDATVQVLTDWAAAHPDIAMTLLAGPRAGAAQNARRSKPEAPESPAIS
ncbi:glycosyltransferase, partial [Candidatus Falkowbacteria bacterium]|nr:glycosyltransferase [Candidatus Falkowbacteria bacterium]